MKKTNHKGFTLILGDKGLLMRRFSIKEYRGKNYMKRRIEPGYNAIQKALFKDSVRERNERYLDFIN